MPLSPDDAQCIIVYQAKGTLNLSSHVLPTFSTKIHFLTLHDSTPTCQSADSTTWGPLSNRQTSHQPSTTLCLSLALCLAVCFTLALSLPPSLNYTYSKCFFLPSLLCSTFVTHAPLSASEVCSGMA